MRAFPNNCCYQDSTLIFNLWQRGDSSNLQQVLYFKLSGIGMGIFDLFPIRSLWSNYLIIKREIAIHYKVKILDVLQLMHFFLSVCGRTPLLHCAVAIFDSGCCLIAFRFIIISGSGSGAIISSIDYQSALEYTFRIDYVNLWIPPLSAVGIPKTFILLIGAHWDILVSLNCQFSRYKYLYKSNLWGYCF